MTRERPDTSLAEDESIDDVSAAETPDNEGVTQEQWDDDDELTALVRANAQEIVRCPWMDNAEVTLSIAMKAYDWSPVTPADEPFLILLVNELLANKPKKTEEFQNEDEEVEDDLFKPKDKETPQVEEVVQTKEPQRKNKTESRKPQPKPDITNPSKLPEKLTETPHDLKVPARSEEKPSEDISKVTETAVEVIANSARDKSVDTAQKSVASESITHFSSSLADIINADSLAITEESPKLVEPQPITVQTYEPPALRQAIKEIKPTEQMNRIVDAGEDQLALLPIPDYQRHTGGLIDFDEDAADTKIRETIGYNAEDENIATLQVGGGSNFPEREVVDIEQQGQTNILDLLKISHLPEPVKEDEQAVLSEASLALVAAGTEKLVDRSCDEPEGRGILGESILTAEEIESSLTLLVERIEASNPPVAEMANENLDKIIETITEFDESGENDIVIEAQAQEKLEELFTELFDLMDMDYTPELTDSLARQTLLQRVLDETEKLEDEEADEAPQDSGVHVIIKKLIAALKNIKSAAGHACAIGRAALMLCNFNFQLKPNGTF